MKNNAYHKLQVTHTHCEVVNGWQPFSKVIWALFWKFSLKNCLLPHLRNTSCSTSSRLVSINMPLLPYFLRNSHPSHKRDTQFSPRSLTACQVNRRQNISCFVQNGVCTSMLCRIPTLTGQPVLSKKNYLGWVLLCFLLEKPLPWNCLLYPVPNLHENSSKLSSWDF